MIEFSPGCVRARFVRREKRFTIIAERGGEQLKAHTNNTGSMLGLLRPGSEILLSPAANPKRKLAWTWELASLQGMWVGINTRTPNLMLRHAWDLEQQGRQGTFPELRDYDEFRAERSVGGSRLDALLRGPGGELWVECKNVTLVEDETALFPDAVTERGQKHVRELMDLAGRGVRVALFFLVQRPDARCFAPADMIDPVYAGLFHEAMSAGVEMWPHQAVVSERGIALGPRLPLAGRTGE